MSQFRRKVSGQVFKFHILITTKFNKKNKIIII
jgi:hypothetical protein